MLGWSSLQPDIHYMEEDCQSISSDNLVKKRVLDIDFEDCGSRKSSLEVSKGDDLSPNTERKIDAKRKCEQHLEHNKKRHTEYFDKELIKATISKNGKFIGMNHEYPNYRRGYKGEFNLKNPFIENTRHQCNDSCKHDSQIEIKSYPTEKNILSEMAFKNISESISKLNLFSKIVEPSTQFPITSEENQEPLKAFIYKNESNGTVAPSMIFNNDKEDFINRNYYENKSIIDPKVTLKSENLLDFISMPCDVANKYVSISSSERSNHAFTDANKSSRLDYVRSQEDLPLIESESKCPIPSSTKKTVLFTYPSPDLISNRKYNIGALKEITHKDLNKGIKDTAHNKQAEIITDESTNIAVAKPRVSQKLLYIQNLSRSSSTKIDETVAYLHYRLRSYENMAVLTRIRNILQNHQLNLIGIYNQLGIPELLVPRRTN